jgi:GntR family transcriptional regulator
VDTDTVAVMGMEPGERVDPQSEVPLTDQLERILRARLEAGTLANAKGKLPSESELSAEHDVSRVTVRRALERLERDGLIRGLKARGWYVIRREQPPQEPL